MYVIFRVSVCACDTPSDSTLEWRISINITRLRHFSHDICKSILYIIYFDCRFRINWKIINPDMKNKRQLQNIRKCYWYSDFITVINWNMEESHSLLFEQQFGLMKWMFLFNIVLIILAHFLVPQFLLAIWDNRTYMAKVHVGCRICYT